MSDELARAKATLLRALEQLDKAEEDLGGSPDRVDLVIIYAIGRDEDDGWHDVGGWVTTPGPKWSHASLLQHAADAQEMAIIAVDDEPEEPEEE